MEVNFLCLYFQDLTDWANDVLKTKNLPLITDLRKSVSDGFTLPTILEIVSKYMLFFGYSISIYHILSKETPIEGILLFSCEYQIYSAKKVLHRWLFR